MGHFDVLNGQQYMSLKTFRKSGEAVATPVWFSLEGDRIVLLTSPNAGKVKRIRNNPQVEVTACNGRGGLLGQPYVTGKARILPEGAESKAANAALTRKYGLLKRLFELMWTVRGVSAVFLEITPA